MSILSVCNLNVEVNTKTGWLQILRDVCFPLKECEILSLVGESGSGKSITCMSIMNMLPSSMKATGQILIDDTNLLSLTERKMKNYWGKRIAMVFQDSVSALNPLKSIGSQFRETIKNNDTKYKDANARTLDQRAIELIQQVRIKSAESLLYKYPHEMSGGMLQRICIAMALAGKPDVLIADEPTTGLDITVQAEILKLIKDLCVEMRMACILVTHDLGVVYQISDRVAVMYYGSMCEMGYVEQIFNHSKHPYTAGLLGSIIRLGHKDALQSIPGNVPNLGEVTEGCPFYRRCVKAKKICKTSTPNQQTLANEHVVFCHHL